MSMEIPYIRVFSSCKKKDSSRIDKARTLEKGQSMSTIEMNMIKADVLIIGSGIAGLRAAMEVLTWNSLLLAAGIVPEGSQNPLYRLCKAEPTRYPIACCGESSLKDQMS